MCGRFTQKHQKPEISKTFYLTDSSYVEEPKVRYNICPTQKVGVITQGTKARAYRMLRWGFKPDWSSRTLINARADHIATSKVFSGAFRTGKRCLFVADGYYEFVEQDGKSLPFYTSLKSGELMAFAAIYDTFSVPPKVKEKEKGATQEIVTFVITTEPNELMLKVGHDRMPVILPPEAWEKWFNLKTPVEQLLPLLKTYESSAMQAWFVEPKVNKVANDGPDCILRQGEILVT